MPEKDTRPLLIRLLKKKKKLTKKKGTQLTLKDSRALAAKFIKENP